PPAMWVSTLLHDNYLGYLAIGRIQQGKIRSGQRMALIRPEVGGEANCSEIFRVTKLLGFQGLQRFELEEAWAGDLVAVAGMETLQVGDTLTTEAVEQR